MTHIAEHSQPRPLQRVPRIRLLGHQSPQVIQQPRLPPPHKFVKRRRFPELAAQHEQFVTQLSGVGRQTVPRRNRSKGRPLQCRVSARKGSIETRQTGGICKVPRVPDSGSLPTTEGGWPGRGKIIGRASQCLPLRRLPQCLSLRWLRRHRGNQLRTADRGGLARNWRPLPVSTSRDMSPRLLLHVFPKPSPSRPPPTGATLDHSQSENDSRPANSSRERDAYPPRRVRPERGAAVEALHLRELAPPARSLPAPLMRSAGSWPCRSL